MSTDAPAQEGTAGTEADVDIMGSCGTTESETGDQNSPVVVGDAVATENDASTEGADEEEAAGEEAGEAEAEAETEGAGSPGGAEPGPDPDPDPDPDHGQEGDAEGEAEEADATGANGEETTAESAGAGDGAGAGAGAESAGVGGVADVGGGAEAAAVPVVVGPRTPEGCKSLAQLVADGDTKGLKNAIEVEGRPADEMDVEGDTALHIASFKGLINVLRYLLDKGGNPNCKNGLGSTPLHRLAVSPLQDIPMATSRVADLLSLLLSKGANPLAVNKSGVVPLDIMPPKVRYLMEPYIPKMEMQVGQQYVALVIGSAGSVMHSIEAQCGVRLVVGESINHNCTITIMGPDDARNKARLSILEIVDACKRREKQVEDCRRMIAEKERKERLLREQEQQERARKEKERKAKQDIEVTLPVPTSKREYLASYQLTLRDKYNMDLNFVEDETGLQVVAKGMSTNFGKAVEEVKSIISSKKLVPPPPTIVTTTVESKVTNTKITIQVTKNAPAIPATTAAPKDKKKKQPSSKTPQLSTSPPPQKAASPTPTNRPSENRTNSLASLYSDSPHDVNNNRFVVLTITSPKENSSSSATATAASSTTTTVRPLGFLVSFCQLSIFLGGADAKERHLGSCLTLVLRRQSATGCSHCKSKSAAPYSIH
ncbi:far upstream element-binding protein [Pelomyxa schiedti]|nr:far upstream element-binding protein [Pelomyxa schiedti]